MYNYNFFVNAKKCLFILFVFYKYVQLNDSNQWKQI